ncbi:MAG: hypothetical protein K5924_00460 [Chloroflexi bacterium]|nr:hypothetical protein [Chloroflexota bacterium]
MQSNLDLRFALDYVEDRQARLRRTSLLVIEPTQRRRPVRRWIGRQLVRYGERLAAESAMRPARAR